MNVVGLYSAERRSKSATATPEKIPSPSLGKRFIHSRPRVATTYSCGNTLSLAVPGFLHAYAITSFEAPWPHRWRHTSILPPPPRNPHRQNHPGSISTDYIARRLVRPAQILPLAESKYNTHVNTRSRFPVDGRRDWVLHAIFSRVKRVTQASCAINHRRSSMLKQSNKLGAKFRCLYKNQYIYTR